MLDGGARSVFAPADGTIVNKVTGTPRIAYLFPGQGSGKGTVSALRRRFPEVEELFVAAGLPVGGGNQAATDVAQPRIVTHSLAALRVLAGLGLTGGAAVGHSLGELTALHWGGALDEAGVQGLAKIRGQVMAQASHGGGGMAGIAAGPEPTRQLIENEPEVVIAGYNGPNQTVVSGPAEAVDPGVAPARRGGP